MYSILLIWQQVVMPCCRFPIFHNFFCRYFDRYVFKYRYKILVSVKLHYGTKTFFIYVSGFKKDLLHAGKENDHNNVGTVSFHPDINPRRKTI